MKRTGRKKIKDGKRIGLFLDQESIRMLKWLAGNFGMSASQWIDNVVKNAYEMTDMGQKHERIAREIAEVSEKKQRLECELAKCLKYQTSKDAYLQGKKERFVRTLASLVQEKRDLQEIREFALNHSILLDKKWSAEELLEEAYSFASK